MYKVWSYRPISTNGVDLTHELEDPETGKAGKWSADNNPLLQTQNTNQKYITRQTKLRTSAMFNWNVKCLKFTTSISYTSTESQTDIFTIPRQKPEVLQEEMTN